jgi:hypothetical protein
MFQPNIPTMSIKKEVITDFTPDMLYFVWKETEYQWGGCTEMLWQHIQLIHSDV